MGYTTQGEGHKNKSSFQTEGQLLFFLFSQEKSCGRSRAKGQEEEEEEGRGDDDT